MNFEELDALIPYARGVKEKVLSMSPYDNIVLLMPGRHADDSKGGDFCVCVTDPTFDISNHQFTHEDIFKDIERRKLSSTARLDDVMKAYLGIIAYNTFVPDWFGSNGAPAMNPTTFLGAIQCLAVAEHRRYARYESKFGGRYLPFRFAAGIAQGLWSADDASNVQRMGRPGVEMLERLHGVPELSKELMK